MPDTAHVGRACSRGRYSPRQGLARGKVSLAPNRGIPGCQKDFKPGAPITTDNTDFVFLNPTDLTLTLEYAFFAAPVGTFCGCDRDTLSPNGRTRYTMLGEKQGGQFSTRLCPTQTEGALKAIVFTSPPGTSPIVVGDALQAGVQIHIFGSAPGQRSESNLQGVTINPTTTREMNAIHTACVAFIK